MGLTFTSVNFRPMEEENEVQIIPFLFTFQITITTSCYVKLPSMFLLNLSSSQPRL